MAESILIDGSWWQQQQDGSWLRWEASANRWEPQPGGPPAQGGQQYQPPQAQGQYQAPAPGQYQPPGQYPAQGQSPQGYGGGPASGGGPAAGGAPPGRVLTILGFVFGGISLLFFPIILGPAGIICAAIGLNKGDPLAKWALGVAVAGMVLGFVIGYLYIESVT